jgi:hypothetical protein
MNNTTGDTKMNDTELELATTLAEEYKAIFPNSHAKAHPASFGTTAFLDTYIGTPATWSNGIRQNDPAWCMFTINKIAPHEFEITSSVGRLSVKPREGSYLAMESVKLPFRKKTGNINKIIPQMIKHFENMKQIIKDNSDNVYGRESIAHILNSL